MKKLAPRLQMLCLTPYHRDWDKDCLADDWPGQEAELRALLAVARAADYDVSSEHHSITRGKKCRLCYALARLEKVSQTGEGKP